MDELIKKVLDEMREISHDISLREKMKMLGMEDTFDNFEAMVKMDMDDTNVEEPVNTTIPTSGNTGVGSWTGSVGSPGSPGVSGPAGSYSFTPTNVTTATYKFVGGTMNANLMITPGSGFKKNKLRYVIVKNDGSTLVYSIQPSTTPREMIGLTQFFTVISSYLAAVLGNIGGSYNFSIVWSELIKDLSIEKHFVEGQPHHTYGADAQVLDIILPDPI